MKIAHVYAKNLQIFTEALESTGCRVNGSQDVDYMLKSLANYNARDVMGLIVFRQHMTKKLLQLVTEFDSLFIFNPLPIVIVCDDAEELYAEGLVKVKNCPLFCVNSIEGTISDVDLQRIFTTLSVMSGSMYDLSAFETGKQQQRAADGTPVKSAAPDALLADEVLSELESLKKGVYPTNANQCAVNARP